MEAGGVEDETTTLQFLEKLSAPLSSGVLHAAVVN